MAETPLLRGASSGTVLNGLSIDMRSVKLQMGHWSHRNPAVTGTAPAKTETNRQATLLCADLVSMTEFYEHVIGLTRLPEETDDGSVFFRLSGGYAGHPVALRLRPVAGWFIARRCLTLSLSPANQHAAATWFDRIGQPYQLRSVDWLGWRKLETVDPEGNTVEQITLATGAHRVGTAPGLRSGMV